MGAVLSWFSVPRGSVLVQTVVLQLWRVAGGNRRIRSQRALEESSDVPSLIEDEGVSAHSLDRHEDSFRYKDTPEQEVDTRSGRSNTVVSLEALLRLEDAPAQSIQLPPSHSFLDKSGLVDFIGSWKPAAQLGIWTGSSRIRRRDSASLKETCWSRRSSENQTDSGLHKKTGAKVLFLAEVQPSLQSPAAFAETGHRSITDRSGPGRRTQVWDVPDEDCRTLELFPGVSDGSQVERAPFRAEMDCAEAGPSSPDQERILEPGLLSSGCLGSHTAQGGSEDHLTPSTPTGESVRNNRTEDPEYSGLIRRTDRKTSTSDSNNNTNMAGEGAWRPTAVRDPADLNRYAPLKAVGGPVHLWEDHREADRTSAGWDLQDHLRTDDPQEPEEEGPEGRNLGCISLNQPSDQKSPDNSGDPAEVEQNRTARCAQVSDVALRSSSRAGRTLMLINALL